MSVLLSPDIYKGCIRRDIRHKKQKTKHEGTFNPQGNSQNNLLFSFSDICVNITQTWAEVPKLGYWPNWLPKDLLRKGLLEVHLQQVVSLQTMFPQCRMVGVAPAWSQ